MSVHIEQLPSFPRFRGLLEVTRLVRDERDLTRLIDGIAATISESLGDLLLVPEFEIGGCYLIDNDTAAT
jgi:hypothetical protein